MFTKDKAKKMTLPLKRFAKESRSKIFTGRLRRSLLVGLLCMLFILLCQTFSERSKTIPFPLSVLPRGGTPDMFVRSTTGPRVVIFVMSDKIDDALCYSVGSAYLSGLPVVVAGYDMPFRGFLSKFDFMEGAIKNAGLNPEDVVIVIDSDTVFTGVDINPFLDQFIAQSAARPEELDALAVRQGRAMAPFIVNSEANCFSRNLFGGLNHCNSAYRALAEKVRKYAAAHPEHNLAFPFDKAPQRNLNSGVVIARRWAYKEFLQKAVNLAKTQAPPSKTDNRWNCDQSVYTALFIDSLTWEVEKDVFSMPLKEQQTMRSPYGVRAGFLDLDRANALSSVASLGQMYLFELHDERWARYLPVDGSIYPRSEKITDPRNINRFVNNFYRRAYAAHGERIFTKLAVPRWVGGIKTRRKTHISLTPPLFALKLRPIDTVNDVTRHTFPVILHAAGQSRVFTKVARMQYSIVGAPWFVPMVHSRKAKRQAMQYLASAPLFLSTNNTILRDSYYTRCGFPYERTIKQVKSL